MATTERSQKDMMFDQSEVNYTTLSNKRNQACANCRFFFSSGGCLIVENQPLSILATGYCDEWTALPEPEDPATEIVEVLEAIEYQLGVNNMSVGAMEKKPTFKERILALVGIKARDEPFTQGFKAIGNGKWVAVWSNNFEDLEGEYFPAKSTDAYIARLDAKEIGMPELYYWHIPYSYGKAKTVARVAADDSPNAPSISIAAGVFYETPIAKAFEKATLKAQGLKMSHGFMYPPDARIDGVYHYYDTFEISVLPPYAAANPYTLFGDDTMPVVSPEKQKELEALLGKDFAAEVVTKAEHRAKELQEQGVGYKGMSFIDTEAREQLATLTKEVTALTETIKAKMPMEDEEGDAKKKKAETDDAEYKKEVSAAITTLAKSQTQLTQNMKQIAEFLDLTPRGRASKSADTLVPPDDAALQELQKGMSGQKSNEEKVFNAAFGSIFNGGLGNGA